MMRVNKITVTLDVYVDFEGSHVSTFSYVPEDGDELAALACAKSEEILLAAAKAEPTASGLI
jgi:hypothetical protein